MEEFMFLFWTTSLWIHICWCAPEVPWCPIAEENKPFELNCTYDMFQDAKMFIIWKSIDKSETSKDISTCQLSQTDCGVNQKSKHSVQNLSEHGKYVFILKFLNVSIDIGDTTIKCILWNLTEDVQKEIFSCRMAVYRPGRGVQCTLQQFTGGVRLQCTSADVYPGIICRFTETLNNVMKKSNILMNTTNIGHNTSGSFVYNSACDVTVYHTQIGTYEYIISCKPDYPNVQMFVQRRATQTINVTHIPNITAVQVDSTLGPGNTNITVMCAASDFQSKLVFKLFFENQEIMPTEYATTSATYKINVNSSFQGKLIRCDADFEDNPWKDFSIYDTKALKLKWPPPTPPFFVNDNSKANLGNVLEITRGVNLSASCVAPGGNPGVSSIRVQCWKNKILWLDKPSTTGIFSFHLFGNETFEIQGCLCIAQQPITSYNATSFIIFYVKPFQGKKGPELWDATANKMMPVYYIIAVTLFLLFLPIILGTCIYISRHGDEIYSYYYPTMFYKRSSTTRHSNSYAPSLPPPRLPPRRQSLPEAERPDPVRPEQKSDPGEESEGWTEDPTFLPEILAPAPPQIDSLPCSLATDDSDYLMPCAAQPFMSLPRVSSQRAEYRALIRKDASLPVGEAPPRSLGFPPPRSRGRPQLPPKRIPKSRKREGRKREPPCSNVISSRDVHRKKDDVSRDATSDSGTTWLDTSFSEFSNLNGLVLRSHDPAVRGGTTLDKRVTGSQQNEYVIASDLADGWSQSSSPDDSDSDILADVADLDCYQGSPKLPPPRQNSGRQTNNAGVARAPSLSSRDRALSGRHGLSSSLNPEDSDLAGTLDVQFIYNDDDRLDLQSLCEDDIHLDMQPLFGDGRLET